MSVVVLVVDIRQIGWRIWEEPLCEHLCLFGVGFCRLNCMGKVLERIYAKRLSYLATSGNLLNNSQIGGRLQRSAVDTALLLLHYIQDQRAKNKKKVVTTTIFLDIKGAFDHVQKDRLINILRDINMPKAFTKWVSSFLTDRYIQLAFEGQIQPRTKIETGIPQGSPISPILFLIYIRNICQNKPSNSPLWTIFPSPTLRNRRKKTVRL